MKAHRYCFGWRQDRDSYSARPCSSFREAEAVDLIIEPVHRTATDRQQTRPRTHPFNGPFSGTTRVSRYQKGKTSLDFTEATVSGGGISWAICKSAPHSRQITTPVPHHSQTGCPFCRPTNSVKVLKQTRPLIRVYFINSVLIRSSYKLYNNNIVFLLFLVFLLFFNACTYDTIRYEMLL